MSFLLIGALMIAPQGQDILIPRGADWRYLDNGVDQGIAWIAPAFDDSAWPVGTAEFGYGDGDEATLLDYGSNPDDKRVTTYFRREFQVTDPSVFQAIELRIKRDDGAIIYLNGVEFDRTNMPAGNVRYGRHAASTAKGGSEEAYFPFYDRPDHLRTGTNTLAVELHISTPDTDDASLDVELIGHRGPSVIRGPYVQMVSETAATIRFRTITPTLGVVRHGSTPGTLQQSVSDVLPGLEHELRVTGLQPGTKTWYSVGNPQGTLAGGDADHWFRTAPPKGSQTPVRAWLLGDAGTYDGNQRAVRDAYASVSGQRGTDLMFFLGDNAYRGGTDQEYQLALFEVYDDMIRHTPSWSTRGNHELSEPAYFGAFTLPDAAQCGGLASGVEDYYSFDWANIHFVCLDSWASDKSPNGPMHTWCDADLASTTQDWIVVYFHHPPYSKGSHDSDTERHLIGMRRNFVPLLEDHGVSLVLSGHSHTYERSYLLDGHHGDSSSFSIGVHALDPGLGRETNGAGAYQRPPGPHGGAVYVVAGSSGQVSPNGMLDHPAMVWSERSLGSVMLDVIGGRMDVTFLDDVGARKDWFTLLDPAWDGGYCIGSVNGEGCVATMSTNGQPSLSSGQPFTVRTSQIRSGSTSMLIYGFEPADGPFAGGRLCISSSLRRTLPANVQGSGPCTGVHDFDFATLWTSPVHPGLTAGTPIYCQTWYRDTTATRSSVSEGIVFTILP